MVVTDKLSEQLKARGELISRLKVLLIGPFEENEILENLSPGIGPADYYLTGILWPRYQRMAMEEDENRDLQAESPEESGAQEEAFPLFNFFRPASIGLTCSVHGVNTPFCVIVRGAKYERRPQDPDNPDRCPADWRRIPFEYMVPVPGKETRLAWNTSLFKTKQGISVEDRAMTVHIRRRVSKDILIVTASLVNAAIVSEGKPDEFCLYQTELEIHCDPELGGTIIARPSPSVGSDDDTLINQLLYRDFREFATGHAVAATWPDPVEDSVPYVRTDWIPQQTVSSVSADGHQDLLPIRNLTPSPFAAEFLSDPGRRQEIVSRLSMFCSIYSQWIEKEEKRIDSLPTALRTTATSNLKTCRGTLERMNQGVAILKNNGMALEAFCLANKTMDNQARGLQRGSKAQPLIWRPFQLAFILLTLPSIVNDQAPDRDTMDLLWFPTGGGKTEAYLGLAALAIFYRRLNGLANRDQGHTDVLMRYTLRLLTVQQFQRAAAMICAADQLRRRNPNRLGRVPISLGLYVGDGTTPNKLQGAIDALEEERADRKPLSTPRLLLECPLCGGFLPSTAYKIVGGRKMEVCCPQDNCPSGREPLPFFTVDEDIYRELPSLLIGTVDKFAQLPRKKEVGYLFGAPDGVPPELIIQDELHLISGPLGTMTGLYETSVDLLCSKNGIRPKIIGSTATIGRARQQVRALFDREVMQFPPPAVDADNSFFATRDTTAPDRIYLGLSSAGRSPKFNLQAATASLLTLGSFLCDEGFPETVVDPYWTLVLYFNSLRELGGAEVMMRDDVLRSRTFYTNRLNCTLREIDEAPVELTSRVSSTEIPEKLRDLSFPLDGNPMEGSPRNTVLASNMISVGVDIPRLGLMLVNGQPKTTSEYIQATSRVGRNLPGLILTLYNAARPRDISHFEHFRNYHQALYRQVEATSVTPWSSRARDKALHAVLVSAIRHMVPGMSDRFSAKDFQAAGPEVKKIVDWITSRAETAGTRFARPDEVDSHLEKLIDEWERRARFYRQAKGKFEYWATRTPKKADPVNPHLMRGAEDQAESEEVWMTPNSMREVEPAAYFTIRAWSDQQLEQEE